MDRLIAPPSTLASSVPRPAVRTPRHASRATLVAGRRLGGRGRAARRGVHDGRTGYAPDGMCMYMAHLIPAPVAPRHLAVHPKTSNTHGRQTPGILLKLSPVLCSVLAPYLHRRRVAEGNVAGERRDGTRRTQGSFTRGVRISLQPLNEHEQVGSFRSHLVSAFGVIFSAAAYGKIVGKLPDAHDVNRIRSSRCRDEVARAFPRVVHLHAFDFTAVATASTS